MSLCWNIFSKVPWSCWYCECYLNDSFEFLRTTQLRNTVFCFSVIFIWKVFLGGAKKKDAEQQTALEWCCTIAAVFYFAGCKWQFLLLCTEWILITYGVPAKAPSQKKKPEISLVLIRKWKKTIKHCCLDDVCFCGATSYFTNHRTST